MKKSNPIELNNRVFGCSQGLPFRAFHSSDFTLKHLPKSD